MAGKPVLCHNSPGFFYARRPARAILDSNHDRSLIQIILMASAMPIRERAHQLHRLMIGFSLATLMLFGVAQSASAQTCLQPLMAFTDSHKGLGAVGKVF